MPLPRRDFDPTEAAIPWRVLTELGHRVSFATPDARTARADDIMITGRGLDHPAGRLAQRVAQRGLDVAAPLAPGQAVAQPQPHRAVLDEPAGQRAVVEQCTQFAWGGADSAGRQAAGRHHPAHRGRLAGHPFGVQRDHHSAATIVLAASAITQATTNM